MYTPKEFEQAVRHSKGLVCYGTGRRFQKFIEQYSKTDILRYLLYCVDRNEELYGKNLEVEGRSIPIRSLEAFQDIREQNIVLLITNLYYDQVLDDLGKKSYLDGIQYYCFTHIYGMLLEENAMKKNIPADIRITSRPVIPKKIHYCWFGEAPIPDKYRRWMESWKKFCPDYEIIRWDESNYDIKKNMYMYEAYRRPAMKSQV